jgi:uncharacterized protein YcbX
MRVQIGRVVELFRYPVKSMAGERIAEAELDWQGIEGDRQYSFYRKRDSSRFPWLSGRDLSALVLYRAIFKDPAMPRNSTVDVITPAGDLMDLHDPTLLEMLSEAAACELGLLQVGRGTHDSMPVSIATTAAHKSGDSIHGRPVDRRRFRSNILVEAEVSPSEWLSGRLAFGESDDSAEILVADAIPRCALITVDPDTGRRDPRIMRTIARSFGNDFGVYGAPARPGRLRAGDPVFLVE